MEKITVLDTSASTRNIGDEIIVESVMKQLNNIFNKEHFLNVSTHEKLGRYSHKILKDSQYSFVAGTNLLNSRYNLIRGNQWNLKLIDSVLYNSFILLGVGWGAYQNPVSSLSRYMYRKVLNSDYIHSVRDNYTKRKLESIGISNVINTGCATMWDLTPEHCQKIPTNKADNVVFTLTDYSRDPKNDQKLINILRENYNKVYFWIQGSKDYDYIKTLDVNDIEFIAPKLSAYEELLDSTIELDYIGTRLHGGIKAMQKGKRTVIIGIDNRALEKKKDFNLNVIDRSEVHLIEDYINGNIATNLTIDFEAIEKWKQQF